MTASCASQEETPTFGSIFFPGDQAMKIEVPAYQRAYSWTDKQIAFFISDLSKYTESNITYYFGHFIIEKMDDHWEIVDGQQRLTTLVLFLIACRYQSKDTLHPLFSMIERFFTVLYDQEALTTIREHAGAFLESQRSKTSKSPSEKEIVEALGLKTPFTRSQRNMVLALIQFHQAFEHGELNPEKIHDYIELIRCAHSSYHPTYDKSVAVNIFEMHNTRGVPLTTLEIVKAMLMKFVFNHGGKTGSNHVKAIQAAFGEIYGMEEQLAARSFRGEMTMDQLLRLHLRVVDDGEKESDTQFDSPKLNSSTRDLIEYIDFHLHFTGSKEHKSEKPRSSGIQYALKLAAELEKSVRIMSHTVPEWDKKDPLVGDVLILEKELSCEFFLILCRRLEADGDKADNPIPTETLGLWERLLFTRDFHGAYHNLKGARDNFPALFASLKKHPLEVKELLQEKLTDGFRKDKTKNLQQLVTTYLTVHRASVTTNAFYWHKPKMIYVLYKYEVSLNEDLRKVMKGTISVEHILPQEWAWNWITDENGLPATLNDAEKDVHLKTVGQFIDGIGNLLLLTRGENSSVGNTHPAEKDYSAYEKGSYAQHRSNSERWRNHQNWGSLITERGDQIYAFMMNNLVEPASTNGSEPPTAATHPISPQPPQP